MHNDKLVCCIYCKCTCNKAQGKSNLAHKTLYVLYVCVYSMTNFQEDKSRRRLDDCEEDKNNKEQQDR